MELQFFTSTFTFQNANNLQFYAMYLPMTVENYLRPVVGSPPLIFQSCIRGIQGSRNYEFFDTVYDKCSDAHARTTTPDTITTPATEYETTPSINSETTTEESEETASTADNFTLNGTTTSSPLLNETTNVEDDETTTITQIDELIGTNSSIVEN